MSKQKLSLEDILDEYSTDEKNSQSKTTGNRLETEKILNSADKINAPPDSKALSGFLHGVRTESRAWFVTEVTGVFHVREHGAFLFLLFIARTAASLL